MFLSTFTAVSLASSLIPTMAQASQYQNVENVSEAEIDAIWEKLFDEKYEGYEFDLTDAHRAAIWQRMYEKAVAYTDSLTDEEFAEIERELEEQKQIDQYFWDNLSPELLWDSYVEDNPEVLRMRSGEKIEIKEALTELYENLKSKDVASMNLDENIAPFYSIGGVTGFWTANFSTLDGLSAATRTAINFIGGTATTTSNNAFTSTDMRRDGFRHWLWNFLSVRDITVGANQSTRIQRTRNFTTNRELATMIVRNNSTLNTSSPSTAQITQARSIRSNILNMNATAWRNLLNDVRGRDDQMDLWNNHWGRVDGQTTSTVTNQQRFQNRWNGTGNTGLVRGNGTGATEMSTGRQTHLFNSGWHRP